MRAYIRIEKAKECDDPLWVALVDFEKAFDTVERRPLWEVLRKQCVPPEYIALMRRLYADQTATVQSGKRSRSISLARGVKQGDPLSSLFLGAAAKVVSCELLAAWRQILT